MHGLQTIQQIKTVLVIEDSYDLAQELVSYLQGAGYSVLTAAYLEDAFDLIHGTPELDAAILDINLGGALVFPVADELAKLKIPSSSRPGTAPTSSHRALLTGSSSRSPSCWFPRRTEPVRRIISIEN
jgi:CheY-like chemotaxis protein